jgi:hypothetical protein
MPQTKTCPKRGGIMKLKVEIEEGDAVSEVRPLDTDTTKNKSRSRMSGVLLM